MNFLLVVPTLNSYKLLPKLIDSIKSQLFKDWRVIFIDGESGSDHKNFLKNICKKDSRFEYIDQNKSSKGIYGAMNEGFRRVKKDEWMIFLGSDDWLASNDVLMNISKLNISPEKYHLLVARAVYLDENSKISRKSFFKYFKNFKLSLFIGSTPAHQGTCFSFLLKDHLYNEEYKLAGDLEYFLRISKFNNLRVQLTEKIIANMSNGGVSQKDWFLRLREVILIYLKYFRLLFFIPLFGRYLIRFKSLIN